MKKLLSSSFILYSVVVFSQQYKITDFLQITKLTRDQLEAKHGLTPISQKVEKKETVFMYEFTDMGAKWNLTIKPGNEKIKNAVISTKSPDKNTIFAKLSYAFTGFEDKMILVDNSTKKEIPYFTKDEFREAYYGVGSDGDFKTLQSKTAEITYKTTFTNFVFKNNAETFTILTY